VRTHKLLSMVPAPRVKAHHYQWGLDYVPSERAYVARVSIAAPTLAPQRSLAAACLALVLAIATSLPAHAQAVSAAEARAVAAGWVAMVTEIKGHWGGSLDAAVGDPREMAGSGRTVGYYCPVEPSGYVVVALRRELAPVRIYSTTDELDPDSVQGLAALVKDRMVAVLQRLESTLGPLDGVAATEVRTLVKDDYRAAWEELLTSPERRGAVGVEASGAKLSYSGGKILLATSWHQRDPYFRYCPSMTGSEACEHTLVGCVPLAAAQIMRHWAWPPYGVGFPYYLPYDWVNMAEEITGSSPQAEIDAVAGLCALAGGASRVDYGCEETTGFVSCWWVGCTSQEDAFKDHFRYSLTESQDRDDADSAAAWFAGIKEELNHNRPMQYRIPGHSVVIDGWQEVGEMPLMQYHVNYGWSGGSNTGWYTVDEIPGGDPDSEFRLANITPQPHVGAVANGLYGTDASFPYRFFDEDVRAGTATFTPGQSLQLLPGVRLIGSGTGASWFEIMGTSDAETRLLTSGDPTKGAVLRGSTIRLQGGGELSLTALGPPKFPRAWFNQEFGFVVVIWEEGWGEPTDTVVERSSSPAGPWSVVGTATAGTTYFNDGAVLPGQLYCYRLRASADGLLSEPSRVVQTSTSNAV
jgi:hypothetical protein